MKISYINRKNTGLFTDISNRLSYNQDTLLNYINEPFSLESIDKQANKKSLNFSKSQRETLVNVLNNVYSNIDATNKTKENIQELLNDNTFTITTGHQLSIFTGPIYFIYKILHTIRLTEELNQKTTDKKFIPVFWMASEDHDFEEIQSVNIFQSTLKWETEQRGPVGRFEMESFEKVKNEFSSFFDASTENEVLDLLKAYSGSTLGEATFKLINKLFGRYGLVILDGDNQSFKKEFASMAMVIGPLFPDKMGLVAEWCKKNKVRFVCPVASNAAILKNNQFVYSSVPSDMTLMEGAAKYLLSLNLKDQLVLVKPTNSKDQLLYESFRQSFLNLPSKGMRPKLIEISVSDVKAYVKKGLNTYFVVPTNDKSTALKFINTLNSCTKNFTGVISVLGTKEWVNFDEISGEYKNKYNFQFPSPNDFNYSYEAIKEVMKIYRKNYSSDMSKMAVQGFDVSYFFISKYLLGKELSEGLMTNFEMFQKGNGNGFENGNVYILKQQDFEIIKIYESFE